MRTADGKLHLYGAIDRMSKFSVVPFSTRTRGGAPVASLIAWGELKDFPFSIGNAGPLINRAIKPNENEAESAFHLSAF